MKSRASRAIGMDMRRLFAGLCLIFTILLAFSNAFASSGSWARQRVGSLAWLHAVYFLDEYSGWAAGSRGTLLSTNDGGMSWQTMTKPSGDAIRDIYFIDNLNGFILCERNIYELKSNNDPRAYIMKTTDGGVQWKRVNLRGANLDVRLMRAIFNRDGHGWAFGEGGALYTTRDAGANWTRTQAPTRYLLLGGSFIDQNNGWLVGAGSTILQTSDGGQTWNHSRVSATTNVRFNSTYFLDTRLGWAVGSGGAIYRTNNGGRSWQAQSSGVTADLLDVKFLDASEGWAVGADGTVLHTVSGGLRWTEERSGTPHTLERIFFTDRNHGWAVGFGGTVIAYGPANPPRLRR